MISATDERWARLVTEGGACAHQVSDDESTANNLLLLWMAAIGWTPQVERDGEVFVAVARHPFAGTVSACARTRAETVWQLFQNLIAEIEAGKNVTPIGSRRAPVAA